MSKSTDLMVRILGDSKGAVTALKETDAAAQKHADGGLKSLAAGIAGAYAVGKIIDFGKESVKAAMDDEASQRSLALTLKNVTNATDAQLASNEHFIHGLQDQTGVLDDELRPAMDRLVRSTHNVGQAQDLLKLALDISAGTGKDLASVADALAKAHDGQTTALKRLGIQTTDASGKTLSFTDLQKKLAETFKGQAADAADTSAGKMKVMQARFEDLKESVGGALLPVLGDLVGTLSGLLGWFNGLGKGTQEWIAKIVLLGGGVIVAAKTINSLSKAFGSVSTAVSSVTGLFAKASTAAAANTAATEANAVAAEEDAAAHSGLGMSAGLMGAAMGVAAVAVIGMGVAASNAKERADQLRDAVKDLSSVTLDQLGNEWGTILGVSLGKVDTATKTLAESNLAGAKRLLDNAGAAKLSAKEIDSLTKAIAAAEQGQATATATQAKYGAAVDDGTKSVDASTDAMVDTVSQIRQVQAANVISADAERLSAAATDANTKAVEAKTNALKADLDAQNAEIDALHAAADANWDVADKADAYGQSVIGMTDKVKKAKGNHTELTAIYRDNAKAADAMAAATVNQKVQQDLANGVVTSASSKIDTYNTAMINAATYTKGPARDAILQRIKDINDIPTATMTAINSAINTGDLDVANQLLADTSKARKVSLLADVDTQALADARNKIAGGLSGIVVSVRPDARVGAHADGHPVAVGENASLVGEQGPEIAHFPAGTSFTPAAKTRRILSGLGGNVFNISVTGHQLSPADIAREAIWALRVAR